MTEAPSSSDHPISPDGPRRPSLLIFDVNETLSDMAPRSISRSCGSPSCCATGSR